IVVVNQFGGDQRGLPRIDAAWKTSLQYGSFVPGNRMQRKVTNPRTLCRERKLLQNGKRMWQHFRAREVGEPKTQIKWIGHNRLVWLWAALSVRSYNSKLSWNRWKSEAEEKESAQARLAAGGQRQEVFQFR